MALIKIDGAIQEHFADILDWIKSPNSSFRTVCLTSIDIINKRLNEEQFKSFVNAVVPMALDRRSNPILKRSLTNAILTMLFKYVTDDTLYVSNMIAIFSDKFIGNDSDSFAVYNKVISLLLRLNENALKPHLPEIISKLSAQKHGFVFWQLLDKFDSDTLAPYNAVLRHEGEKDIGPTGRNVLAKLNQ